MKIFIVQGSLKSNNRREFLGATETYDDCFKITLGNSNSIYEHFVINQYDLKTNSYTGGDILIALNQKFSADGHLEPKEDRDTDGFCHTGLWGHIVLYVGTSN